MTAYGKSKTQKWCVKVHGSPNSINETPFAKQDKDLNISYQYES